MAKKHWTQTPEGRQRMSDITKARHGTLPITEVDPRTFTLTNAEVAAVPLMGSLEQRAQRAQTYISAAIGLLAEFDDDEHKAVKVLLRNADSQLR